MSSNRITMKDIAKEAGVSTATVSYVLNYSEKEKISHETRMRIFEAANKLKYVPNMNAKSLASQRSYLVGIIINMEERNKKSKIFQYYDLSREIQKCLYLRGYDVVLLPTKEMEKDIKIGQKRSLDAVFIMDMDEERFKRIATQFYVPAIFIEGYVEDPIFCKIVTDYSSVLKRAEEQLGKDFYVVMEDHSNKNVYESIARAVPDEDIFVNGYDANLIEFLQKHKNQNGLVIGEILGMQVENYVDNRNISVVVNSERDIMLLPDTKTIVVSNKRKAEKAVEVMDRLLRLDNANEVERVTYVPPLS
ncbi:LacI family DNA-binding transcriptional regulator [Konateibacter massiliensis]|uniref:LacI family DNA-binding transcriptional regulator n=1 Tax=Konateibacter massiliensis TaxID=2002841 RepID=UPI000C1619A9|nr:LacI family DNA-binding transcriptional regulator [Konateibacter massiliensis]